MSFKSLFITLRDNYVRGQVADLNIPTFPDSHTVRLRYRFSGRVQHVGFRLAVCELAGRLGLTGWCQNLDSGDVLAELQGTEDRIQFLVAFLQSRKRIKIRSMEVTPLAVLPNETGFMKKDG
ncbi:MAG: acylphosphatase [Oscillibacter sp.]|nr:acylphosphatase [Oscillibacter sp.]